MVDRMLAAADMRTGDRNVSPGVGKVSRAGCAKRSGSCCRLPGEPPMTRFVANELSTAHWFDISAAERDLGYCPEVSIEEGLKRLREWLPTSGLLAEKR